MTSEPRVTATSLFFGALRDLSSNFGAVLRIGGIWFAIYLAVNALAGQRYAHWVIYDVDRTSSAPSEWYLWVVFLGMLGIVASSWHRFIHLGEAPRAIPRMRLVIILKYMLGWVGMGIVIGAIVLIAVVLPGLYLGNLVDQVPSAVSSGVIIAMQTFRVQIADLSFAFLAVAAGVIGVVAFLVPFVLFRLGVGLPSIAILDGQGIGLRASWRATARLGRPVFWASVLAALCFLLVYVLTLVAVSPSFEGYSTGSEVVFRVVWAVLDIVGLLVGTAILTRIYGALPPELV